MPNRQLDSGIPVPKFGIRMVLVLFGGFFLHLALGTYFTIGNFMPYIISYIRNRTDDTSVRNVDGLWISSLGGVGTCVGMSMGGVLDRKYGPRLATFVGCLIFCGCTVLSGVTVKKSFFWLVATNGFFISFGLSCAYGPPVQTAIKWLPNRSSLAAGLVVSGFGGGALIFNQVMTAFINPDNLSPDITTANGERYFTDPDLLDRVPTCFFMLGGIYFVMQLIGIACITTPPSFHPPVNKEIKQKSVNDDDGEKTRTNGIINTAFSNKDLHSVSSRDLDTNEGGTAKDASHSPEELTKNEELSMTDSIKIAFRTRSFYIIWFTIMFIDGGMQFFISLYKAYGQTFIDDDHFLALVGSLSSVFNCVGRPVWGSVMDIFGFKVTIRCISVGFVAICSTLLLTENLAKEAYLVWICAIFFFYCGIWAIAPSALAKLFGVKNMAVNYGFIYSAIAIASLIGGITGTTLKDIIGWHGIFFMSAGMAAIPFLLSFLFNGVDQYGKQI